MKKLWDTVKNVFTQPWLSVPADLLARAVFGKTWDMSDEKVVALWSALSADIAATQDAGLPGLINVMAQGSGASKSRKQLWYEVAKKCSGGAATTCTWENLVELLLIPFWWVTILWHPVYAYSVISEWSMSDFELELWDDILSHAISAAGSLRIGPCKVAIRVFEKLGKDSTKKYVVLLLVKVPFSIVPLKVYHRFLAKC